MLKKKGDTFYMLKRLIIIIALLLTTVVYANEFNTDIYSGAFGNSQQGILNMGIIKNNPKTNEYKQYMIKSNGESRHSYIQTFGKTLGIGFDISFDDDINHSIYLYKFGIGYDISLIAPVFEKFNVYAIYNKTLNKEDILFGFSFFLFEKRINLNAIKIKNIDIDTFETSFKDFIAMNNYIIEDANAKTGYHKVLTKIESVKKAYSKKTEKIKHYDNYWINIDKKNIVVRIENQDNKEGKTYKNFISFLNKYNFSYIEKPLN